MKTRPTSVAAATQAASGVLQKRPVSMAVSMALLAAAATAAAAAEPAGVPAESAGAQGAAQQDVSKAPSTDSKEADQTTETIVTVYGVRESQIRAIELKRKAADIQDSISAESIG